jgi:hypothetical protein
MTMQLRNTRELRDPKSFRLKMLLIAEPGTGKTRLAATAPNPGFIAKETGNGAGLQTLTDFNIPFVVPDSLQDLDLIATGNYAPFKDKETIVIDSYSDITNTIIRDAALEIPRAKGESQKRKMGVPELDDYQSMGILSHRILRRFLDIPDKHIIVTARLKTEKPDPETGIGKLTVGPDLPGQMFLGAPAMFDFVIVIRSEAYFVDPKNKATRAVRRYLMTQPDGVHLAKCRANEKDVPLLPERIPFDLKTGEGTIPDLLARILKGYSE